MRAHRVGVCGCWRCSFCTTSHQLSPPPHRLHRGMLTSLSHPYAMRTSGQPANGKSYTMDIAPCGRPLGTSTFASGAGSLGGFFICAAFDRLHLVVDHSIGRVPDAPHLHLPLTVGTPER